MLKYSQNLKIDKWKVLSKGEKWTTYQLKIKKSNIIIGNLYLEQGKTTILCFLGKFKSPYKVINKTMTIKEAHQEWLILMDEFLIDKFFLP